ncbi:hypothetical protein AB4Z46_31565 [Variovorax sp. M-6]|uniref:hypothetical protein n=1 Tax=Variovorax sp. M-6 TaxID=3233041 RepID=UPI003F9B9F63
MAQITMGDVKEQVQRTGFITVCEPACGAGGMLIACADAIQAQGVNPQEAMHATAIDIDATAVHMAYVQLSVLHVPAIVVHGNALTGEERAHWVTPAHVLGGWDWRLRSPSAKRDAASPLLRPALPNLDPMDAGVKKETEATESIRAGLVASRLDQLDLFAA